MIIKVKKDWKDLADSKPCKGGLTRRDFLARGMATGLMAAAVPKAAFGQTAASNNCPAPSRPKGALAQFFAEGGPTMGARFISEAQAAAMNANMASNYGISGQGNLQKLGPNMVVDKTSPFGFTILQGPPGYPGGATAWQTKVLAKISGGAHLGPFNQDDGAGINSGLLGGVSPFKMSQMGKDIKIGVANTLAAWANGLPSAAVSSSNLAPAKLANTFSMTPAASGLVTANALTAASNTVSALTAALDPVFNISMRKGAQQLMQAAGCAFYGNSALADPTYGTTLFNPTQITALQSVTVANLTSEEQAQLAAFYQSAAGVAGGIIIQFGGRDYHGQSPQNSIAPADIEEARAVVMFLAACDAAQAPGALIYTANGQAIANGTSSVTATINGTQVSMNAANAAADAGGAYNAGLIIFYDPNGSPPAAQFTGTVASDGSATTDPNVGSSKDAVAGLYLSALKWIQGGTVSQQAVSAMQASGAAATPTNVMVI